jgi:hypothetical protein
VFEAGEKANYGGKHSFTALNLQGSPYSQLKRLGMITDLHSQSYNAETYI